MSLENPIRKMPAGIFRIIIYNPKLFRQYISPFVAFKRFGRPARADGVYVALEAEVSVSRSK
jgi:hypothetical protein